MALQESSDMSSSTNSRLTKGELKIPSRLKRAISLSDIIAATIGEEVRSCDSSLVTNNLQEDRYLQETNYGTNVLQFPGRASNCGNITDNINGSYSNFGADFYMNNNYGNGKGNDSAEFITNVDSGFGDNHDENKQPHLLQDYEHSNNACDLSDLLKTPAKDIAGKTSAKEATPDLGFKFINNLGFDTEMNFLSPLRQICENKDQPSQEARTSTETNIKAEVINIPSDDSDLEDSMLFVDPDEQAIKGENFASTTNDINIEPEPKKPKLCEDNNTLTESSHRDYTLDCNPVFLSFLYSDCDVASENSSILLQDMRDQRSRSFSGRPQSGLSRQKARLNLQDTGSNKTPGLSRTRSFSEAGSHGRLGNHNMSTSSLLESTDHALSNNPFFEDLKSTLLDDCSQDDCPRTLFDTLSDGPKSDVYARERNLQARFSAMQSNYSTEISNLSKFYQRQSAEVETERLKEIHDENMPRSFRNHLNRFYDNQLHMIMERVEKSLLLLSTSKREVIHVSKAFKTRPMLSKRAVAMMEEWYQRNLEHPYPSQTAVEALARAGEITPDQVKKWFANKRNRSKGTKPVLEVANMKRKRQYSARW